MPRSPNVRPNPWIGAMEELGGYRRIVVADSEDEAKAALMKAWQDYDAKWESHYRGRINTFDDLAEFYGAYVRSVPWNQYIYEGV